MPRQSSREKTARHRLRKAGQLPPLPTCGCGRTILGNELQCWICRRSSPEARAKDAERKRAARRQLKTPSSGDQG